MSRTVGSYLRRHHLGLIALFIALGGTAYAATELPRNSVGTKQLKKGAVRTADIRAGAVKLGKIDKAARASLKGQPGATGPQGPAGTFTSVVIRFNEFTQGATSANQYRVECKPGEVALGGGAGFNGSPGSAERLIYSGPNHGEDGGFPKEGEVPTGWDAGVYNSEGSPKKGRVYVTCAR